MNTDDLVNMDITTLITLVSDITNDPNIEWRFGDIMNWKDKCDSIYRHIVDEKISKVTPIIMHLKRNKNMVVVDTAFNKFKDIIEKSGSDSEKYRLKEIESTIQIIQAHPSERFNQLKNIKSSKSKKIWSDVNIDIFGTADRYGIHTISGNVKLCKYMWYNMKDLNFTFDAHRPRCFVGQRYEVNDKSEKLNS